MKILIIGLGYAGNRYRRAFEHIATSTGLPLSLAYVGRRRKATELPYFDSVPRALEVFAPDIVVVSVNDHSHAPVLKQLAGYRGFVLCEKPLVTPGDDLDELLGALDQVGGFALDLVERYSDATQQLRDWVGRHDWQLVRASFHWGKDRINDYRPTCGVTSEVIHALDLVGWICPRAGQLQLGGVLGVRSDFSISGAEVLDTVQLTASMGEARVTGYASFVNIVRQRTLDYSFVDHDARLIHARLVFDTPRWDQDQLRIWTRGADGAEELLHEFATAPDEPGLDTLHKLSRLCRQVVRAVALKEPPRQPFAGLDTAVTLQRLLNELETHAQTPAPARYVLGETRVLLAEDSDLESLG
ncbi:MULTISPECIES: Gfo/Idh/MocA family oxidoreductase [Pseudomonadaceae]|jgi:predicted dehydrogenase|uniref:Predicted dehydrogenase n=2 Tax=Pseudomonadaceae TaxID=135621 RepID=A0A1H2LSZ5_9PSED|nr:MULTISPECIES: Gfo/Idh/MocA family oxidoreductase [Pseudomonadaceae]MBA4681837.1 Gfo/Idh/MocA family oxidoreductase [Pseudomonas sp.]AEA84298.1 putative oxidoreductase [Stutzerimonas stutzeri DSM 4166]MBH4102374.1 Gfo/Idh/MocA family oxidoreductase [Pseudomonas aeruginosa]MDI5991755.1 Gfo/Idh/MocA family oxidoreductase [Pseudomonas sp. MDMC216]MDI6006151.1 Gfo/Idh/MocA family oxidoreductase [Pseudomonas sp. MDMC17]